MSQIVSHLTDEQSAAVAATDRSVALTAGAGCGKTFVLTERFLSYLDPSVLAAQAQLHELVAITFTDAAAREMRQRVRHRCYERLQQAESPAEAECWQQLLRALDAARISTIHSFSAALLRAHAVEAELDPRFDILEPPAAELLRLQTLDDRLRQLLLSGDQALVELSAQFGLQLLRDHLARLLGKDVAQLAARWAAAEPAELVDAWERAFAEKTQPQALGLLLESGPFRQLQEIVSAAQQQPDELRALLLEIGVELESLASGSEPLIAVERVRGLAKATGAGRKKNWADPQQYEHYKQVCTEVRDRCKKSILAKSIDRQAALVSAETGLQLLQLVAEVSQHYEAAKAQRNALEHDDLLRRAQQLLTDDRYPAICQQLNQSTQLLMVDEFQDTDPLQVSIIQAFCGPGWREQGLFVVGDPKQSIYRFRGAEPRVSNEMREALPEPSRLSLTTNFRSQPAILEFVNALFYDALGDDFEPLEAHRQQVSPQPAVEFLWATPQENPQDPSHKSGSKSAAREEEARTIARRLLQLTESDEGLIPDPTAGQPAGEATSLRPLRLGDVAILLRSLSDVADYEAALREHGLDYYLVGGHAFYAQQEVFDILNLLRAVVSGADELSLAGALRSPLFALEDETLFWLVQAHGSLNAGLSAAQPLVRLGPEEQEKVRRAAATLQTLRAGKDRWLVAELLEAALAQTGFDAALLCDFLGERKLANVRKLVEQARAIDRTSPGDLQGFITQLAEFVARAPKEPLAATQTEGDVIRIMTIHQAKGLEFPLVVVPDLNRANRHAAKQPEFDLQLGPLVPAEDPTTIGGFELYRFEQHEQDLAERQRLLYVACTRAADYLILSSGVSSLNNPTSEWMKLLAQRFDLQDGSLRASLPGEYAVPQVAVTTQRPPLKGRPASSSRGGNLEKLVRETQALISTEPGPLPASVAPIPIDRAARRRFSFSRLTGNLTRAGLPSAEPQGFREIEVDARGLGTLVHAVLERVDFEHPERVPELCRYLAPLHISSQVYATADEAAGMIGRFLASDRAERMAASQLIRREVEFLLPWTLPGESYQGLYLQGYIDCLYQDAEGGWHLIDYKSNLVSAAGAPETAQRYQIQMYVYGLACQQVLGTWPAECVLHFLRPATEVVCQWDDPARAAAKSELDAAIRADCAPAEE